MADVLVIDTSSLLNFNMFYTFDKNGKREVYPKLRQFLLEKIKSKEIVIIDLVYAEIRDNRYTVELKKDIQPHIVKTKLLLFKTVEELIKNYTRKEIIEQYGYSDAEVETKLSEYEEKNADLYLIAYCLYLKKNGYNPILVTDETRGEDKKIIEKIPTICQAEGIRFKKIPQVLFEHYEKQLEFKLTVKP